MKLRFSVSNEGGAVPGGLAQGGTTMRTALCERLGIEVPVIQAPMGGAAGLALAAAVSSAGGLGRLAPWRADAAGLRQHLRQTRTLTDGPFGANFVIAFPQEERLGICLKEGVTIVSSFWGDL